MVVPIPNLAPSKDNPGLWELNVEFPYPYDDPLDLLNVNVSAISAVLFASIAPEKVDVPDKVAPEILGEVKFPDPLCWTYYASSGSTTLPLVFVRQFAKTKACSIRLDASLVVVWQSGQAKACAVISHC